MVAFLCAATVTASGTASADAGYGFDVASYTLHLTPDLKAGAVAGHETIRLRATVDGLRTLSFSGNALAIDEARVDGRRVASDLRGKTLDFVLPRRLLRGQAVTLRLSYHGVPARGIVRSATGLHTSYFACDWMICAQDRFGDKASLTLRLQVPRELQTLGVGRMVATGAGPSGTRIDTWRSDRPYSAYLYAFAVGRLARASDRLGGARLVYLSDMADADDLRRRFAATPPMVRFLADKAGLPLPVHEYRQLMVAGSEAQEAATHSVLGDAVVPDRAGTGDDWAIAHELAHQWWGNLVTCATLTDFWLNEGLATFMTAAWKEHRHGRAAYDAELDVARGRLAKARAAGFDKPLAWTGAYPSLATRRAVQYGKGALFLDHLRAMLGERAFWGGLRRYTRAHAGGVVTSVDLQRAMEGESGRDLDAPFAEWVYGTPAPQDAMAGGAVVSAPSSR